ncbi:MAG: YczE/YyaS/YitT family protein [Acidimicrobiales bacterium]
MTRRLVQLYAGLVLYGASMALMIRAGLGLDPWDVLHQGLADRLPLSFGIVTIVVGALVLLAWIPLRQRPGIGTVSNVIVIGLAVDATLAVLPAPDVLAMRVVFVFAGVGLNGVATAAYIGARLGPGPRDGLMTGLVRRTGRSVRMVRTSIEVTVLAVGWLLGGTVGVGTVLYALGIGPLVHVLLPAMTVPELASEAVVSLRR